jgi:hypothetical protein
VPEHYRRVTVLRDYDGLEWIEIARAMEEQRLGCAELHRRALLELAHRLAGAAWASGRGRRAPAGRWIGSRTREITSTDFGCARFAVAPCHRVRGLPPRSGRHAKTATVCVRRDVDRHDVITAHLAA